MRSCRDFVLVVIAVVLLFSISVTAQDVTVNGTEVSAAEPTTKSDYGLPWGLEKLPDVRKQVAEMEIADKEAKTKLLDIYDKAIGQWNQLQVTTEETSVFISRRRNIPSDLNSIKEQSAKTANEVFPDNTGNLSLADVQKEVAGAQVSYEEAKKNAAILENEPKRRAERRVNIPVESAAVRQQLTQMREKLPAAATEVNVADTIFAGRILQIAQIMAMEAKIETLAEELKFYDVAGDILTAKRELASRIVLQAEKRQKYWQEQLLAAQRRETEKLKEKATETVQQTKYAHPLVQKLAQENAELAHIQADLIRQMEQANQYSKNIGDKLARLNAKFSDLKKEIETAGEITSVMGVLLLSERDDLQDTGENRAQIKARLAKISSAKLNWSKYDKQWSDMVDIEAVAKIRLQEEQLTERDAGFDEIFKEAVTLLEDRRKDIKKISDYYEDLSTVLAKLDVQERKLVSTVSEYKAFIDENILWTRSSASIRPADVSSVGSAIGWFVNPKQWIEVWRYLWSDFRNNISIYVLAGIFVVWLWLYRLGMTNRLDGLAKHLGHTYSDKYMYTLKALVFSIIIIVPLPLFTSFVSWRLLQAPPTLTYVHIIGRALKNVTVMALMFMAFIRFCRKSGLSDHFYLRRESMDVLARYLRLTFLILIPVIFLRSVFCDSVVEDVYRISLGRLGFVAEMIVVLLFFLISFRPSGAVAGPLLAGRKDSWLSRMRHIWYVALVALPFVFAVLHLSGYDYAAGELYYKFVATILLCFAIMFCKGMLTRWLTLVQARLVLRQKEDKKSGEAAHISVDSKNDNQESSKAQTESEEDSEQLVVDISQQTLSLIRWFSILAVFLGIWLIWKNVLPALSGLENIKVWDTIDAQGATVIISLGNIIKAVLIFVMMVVAARNAPGLMEILILQRLPLNQGVRFAVTSLLRYILVIVGVVMTLGQIGIGWTKVQWLVAAMTVGLGFGLQEIFANFVSGLIILFEQPIRIGDAVTVGDVDGVVTKIKMRATTIRKWDQKELVVPNKEFITGKVLNWSLSDKTLRMEFPVGVAYGSDIKKTEKTLYRIAHNQKGVIHDDPAPVVIFRSFGESSLEFELRVYVPNMDNYLKIWHEINCNIDSEFRKEGIEIAFPQRDIHIRSVEVPFPVQMDSRRDSTEESKG